MNKKILIIFLSCLAIIVLVLVIFMVNNNNKNTFDNYESLTADEDDSVGGMIEVPEGFKFKFINHDKFKEEVPANMCRLVENTNNDLLLAGDWEYVSISDNIITIKDKYMSYTIEIVNNNLLIKSIY